MKKVLLLLCALFVAAALPAQETAQPSDEALYKVTVAEAPLYRKADTSSGVLSSPYTYGEILEGVRIEGDGWISIPFGSDRRGYIQRRCVAPLDAQERAGYLAQRAEEEAAAAQVQPAPEMGAEEVPVRKMYPFFNGVKAGRNAIWFIAAALIASLVGMVRGTRLTGQEERDIEIRKIFWRRMGRLLLLVVALELWYICSLGFEESMWFLSERHSDWFLLLFFAATALQGFTALAYLCEASGRGDMYEAGFSLRWLMAGVVIAAALYGLFAAGGHYILSAPFTCVVCLTVGLIPHVVKAARHVPLRVALVYGALALGALIMLAASLVILVAMILCLIVMVIGVVMVFKESTYAVTHMEEYTDIPALRRELAEAESAFLGGLIDAAQLQQIRDRIEPILKKYKGK